MWPSGYAPRCGGWDAARSPDRSWPVRRYVGHVTGAQGHRPAGWNDEPASGRRFGKIRDSSLTVAARVTASFGSRGEGFGRLARSHVGSFAGDALVGVALAGTLFFTPPSTEARQNLALYLLLTLAPFVVLGPFLGRLYERFPGAYRSGLVLSSALRAGAALVMIPALDTVMLFPLAFVMLVLSRFHGISRSSVLPTVLERPHELISANAAIARLGVYGAAIAGLVGLAAGWIGGQGLVLVVAAVAFTLSAVAAGRLPPIEVEPLAPARPGQRTGLARPIRLTRFATAAVRLLNGYLVVLVAFACATATRRRSTSGSWWRLPGSATWSPPCWSRCSTAGSPRSRW